MSGITNILTNNMHEHGYQWVRTN